MKLSIPPDYLFWLKPKKTFLYIFENDLDINDGDDVDINKFLQDTKMKFANEMRLKNAKSIISFRLFVWIHF